MKLNLELPSLLLGGLTIPLPIIQGGMGVAISLSGLASAVANEGGVGVIATAGIGLDEPDLHQNFEEANLRALRREIRTARAKSSGFLGVNIMTALSNHDALAYTAAEEGIDMIISGAGLPLNLPACRPAGSKTLLVPIVSSGRAAIILGRRWKSNYDCLPDAFIVEGPLAGGHLGFRPEHLTDPAFALERLVAEVLEVAADLEKKYGRRIPVIAAGGIYTGADIRRFLDLGAAGVQMATRFVTTIECDASNAFKQAYIDAKEDDLVIIQSPVGMPGRAIRNSFIDDINQGQRKPYRCIFHCIVTCDVENSPYCIANALISARRGHLKNGFAFAGSNAWRATDIISVHELVKTLKDEYRRSASPRMASIPGLT